MNRKQKKILFRIIISFVLTAVLAVAVNSLELSLSVIFFLFAVPYLVIGYDIWIKAFSNLKKGRVFDENFLMAFASAGAFAIAILDPDGRGDFIEAVAVILFYQVGEFFEGYIVDKSRREIDKLVNLTSDIVHVEQNNELRDVDPDTVNTGSVIVVKPGEKIPIDGVVVEGKSSLDTAALTGESMPRSIDCGDEVLSGCINISGAVRIRTSRLYEDSTAAKILELVENSSAHKARSEKFISRFARVYTPFVCFGALALALLPPVYLKFMTSEPAGWFEWVYRALTFLVISCPCALVISIPLTFFAAIGGSSRNGILVKGATFMEKLARTDYAVMDKTGTLTEGSFCVSRICNNVVDADKLIKYAAYAESSSNHPVAQSIVKAFPQKIDRSLIGDIEEIAGQGIRAEVGGQQVLVGNEKLLVSSGISGIAPADAVQAGTAVHVAVDGSYIGSIIISDSIRETSASAVGALKKMGINRIAMLTGDTADVAGYVAGCLGIGEVHSGLLPHDKVAVVQEIMKGKPAGSSLIFVGDGINDAPVLTVADVGIAMGGIGSDAAIEAADVIIMDDNPMKIAKAVGIARRCMSITWQNILFALGVKFSCLVLGAIGYASLWLAIFADVGVLILVVLNALRAMINVKESKS